MVGLAAFVGLGLTNVLGLRIGTASASEDGIELRVMYARVTRSGLETPWQVEVRSPAGFDGPVTMTTSAEYFERFDFNQWVPGAIGHNRWGRPAHHHVRAARR